MQVLLFISILCFTLISCEKSIRQEKLVGIHNGEAENLRAGRAVTLIDSTTNKGIATTGTVCATANPKVTDNCKDLQLPTPISGACDIVSTFAQCVNCPSTHSSAYAAATSNVFCLPKDACLDAPAGVDGKKTCSAAVSTPTKQTKICSALAIADITFDSTKKAGDDNYLFACKDNGCVNADKTNGNPCATKGDTKSTCTSTTTNTYSCSCTAADGYYYDGTTVCLNPCTEKDSVNKNPCDDNGNTAAKCLPVTATSYVCQCTDGYDGSSGTCLAACKSKDSADYNPCNNNGDSGATCISGTATNYVCRCSDGFSYSGGTCNDIDECAGSPCRNGACKNSAGSYSCSCNSGYKLTNNGKACEDVDECASSSTCRDGGDSNASCLNTQGSYSCFCSDGYSSDGTRCTRSSGVSGASSGLQAVGNFFTGLLTILFLPIILPIALLAQLFSGRSSSSFPKIAGKYFSRDLEGTEESQEEGIFAHLLLKLRGIDWKNREL